MSFEPLLYFFAFVIVPIKNKERERERVGGKEKEKKDGKEGVGRRWEISIYSALEVSAFR